MLQIFQLVFSHEVPPVDLLTVHAAGILTYLQTHLRLAHVRFAWLQLKWLVGSPRFRPLALLVDEGRLATLFLVLVQWLRLRLDRPGSRTRVIILRHDVIKFGLGVFHHQFTHQSLVAQFGVAMVVNLRIDTLVIAASSWRERIIGLACLHSLELITVG